MELQRSRKIATISKQQACSMLKSKIKKDMREWQKITKAIKKLKETILCILEQQNCMRQSYLPAGLQWAESSVVSSPLSLSLNRKQVRWNFNTLLLSALTQKERRGRCFRWGREWNWGRNEKIKEGLSFIWGTMKQKSSKQLKFMMSLCL